MRHKKIFYFALLLIMATGCKKFVEIDPPKNLLVTSNLFAHNETATSALLSIYGQMSDVETANLPLFTGLSGDELENYSSGSAMQLYVNSANPNVNSLPGLLWSSAYSYIYQANALYEGCNSSTTLDPEVKKQLMAEALFIRAYWHFYLVNLYGDVPLVTSTNYLINSSLPRTSKLLVYQQIVSDLRAAQSNLKEQYISANSLTATLDRVRPNKAVATALLARVYIYTNQFVEAETQSSNLIDGNTLYHLSTINDVFLKNSSESIWQLLPSNSNYVTKEGLLFILTNNPIYTEQYSLSSALIKSFEEGDLRASTWVGKFTDVDATPNVDYYYSNKYKLQSSSTVSECSMIFRLAEQYLIRAEARLALGNTVGAIEDINTLRTRARGPITNVVGNPLPNLLTTLTNEQIKVAILHERQTELFTEQGHRWLDIKRTGSVDGIMQIITPIKGGTWTSQKQLWPLPISELLNNKKLIQNPGYSQ